MKNLRQPSPFRLWGLLASQPGSDSLVDWISDAFFQRIQQLAELGKSLAQIVDQHTRHTSPHQGHHITPCTRRYISIVHSKFAAHIKICGALAHLLFARSCQLQSTMKRHLGRQVCVTVKFALPSSIRLQPETANPCAIITILASITCKQHKSTLYVMLYSYAA